MDDARQAQSQSQSQRQPHQLLLSPDEQNIIKLLRLRRLSKLPEPICEKVDEAVDEFLENVRSAIRKLVFYDPYAVIRTDGEDGEEARRGLDCDLDTEEEVEAMIRCYPSVLTEEMHGAYPIHWQIRTSPTDRLKLKASSFIPLFAKLGMELGQFSEELRGGLVAANYKGYNTLQFTAMYLGHYTNRIFTKDHHHRIDEKCLAVLKRLQEENLLSKEDNRDYNLVGLLCSHQYPLFPEQRFRFLCDWDPTMLMTPCIPEIVDYIPITYAIQRSSFGGFVVVLEAGMRHFPTKLGFVFLKVQQEDDKEKSQTPYQYACEKYGTEYVTKEILDRISAYFPATGSAKSDLLSFAADEAIDLDGLYLFLRREPTVLSQLP